MPNDIDLYDGGELQPYDPGLPVLAPLSPNPDSWGNTDLAPREIDQYPGRHDGPTLFGAALPAGTTPQQVNAVLGEIGAVYLNDFSKLNYPSHLIQSAISFFMEHATKLPKQVRRQHNFNLRNETDDWLAEAFGNHLSTLGGTQAQKQQFLDASLQWLALANQKLNSQPVAVSPAQGSAPSSNFTQAALDSLSDSDYDKVIKANDAARAATMGYLEKLWGQSLQANLRMVDAYFQSLPLNEQRALDVMTTGYISALNTKEVILGLYQQAINSQSLPSGAALTAEIEEHHRAMAGPNRKAWMNDERMGARYRELIRLRDGG